MRILLSNDDGYQAQGIQVLYKKLHEVNLHDELVLFAPDRNRSAASNSLTLMEPLRVTEVSHNVYCINGTPTDCVHLGINGAIEFEADIVISGINDGANMGDDVLYSGTVAAAMEGRFLGKPSIAVSLCGRTHFDTAAQVLVNILGKLNDFNIDTTTILNINVPDIPLGDLKGIKVTRLGQRHRSAPVLNQTDPRGNPIHWVGPAGDAVDGAEGTDFHAIESGYASVTPLKIDLTNYEMCSKLSESLSND